MRNYIKFYSFYVKWSHNGSSGTRVFCVNELEDAPERFYKITSDISYATFDIQWLGPWYFLMRGDRIADLISALGAAIAYDQQTGLPTGLPISTKASSFDKQDWYQVESPRADWSNGH